MLSISVVCFFVFRMVNAYYLNYPSKQPEGGLSKIEVAILGQAVLVFGATSAILVALLSNTWLQILIAPKIYLIEYAAELIK